MNNYTDEELDELSDFEKMNIINDTFESWSSQVNSFTLTDIGSISKLSDVIVGNIRISIDKKFQNLSEDELFNKTLLYKKISYDNVEQFYKMMYVRMKLGNPNGLIVRKRVKEAIEDLKYNYGREYSRIFEIKALQLLGETPRYDEKKDDAAKRLRGSRISLDDRNRRGTTYNHSKSSHSNDEIDH